MEDKMQLSLMTMIMEVVITVDSEDMEDTEATEAEEGPDLTIVMMKKKKFLIINFKYTEHSECYVNLVNTDQSEYDMILCFKYSVLKSN